MVKPGGANYLVDTVKGYCSCPFRAENGLCKHRVWAGWQAEADARAAEWEEQQAARYELLAGKF